MSNTTKSTMNLKPPKNRSAEAFVEAAGKEAREEKAPIPNYPWDDPKVREDVIKSVNLRLPEPYILKLQYVSEMTRKSQQELIREALLPALDTYIRQMENTA